MSIIAIITIFVHATQFLALINATRLCHKKILKLIIKNERPLQQVECDLSWAGCTVTTQRKDIEAHIASDPAHHIAILARVCKELKDENVELKKALRPRRM